MSVENFVVILGILFKTLMSADADKELADTDELPRMRMRLRIRALRIGCGCGSHFSYPRRPLHITYQMSHTDLQKFWLIAIGILNLTLNLLGVVSQTPGEFLNSLSKDSSGGMLLHTLLPSLSQQLYNVPTKKCPDWNVNSNMRIDGDSP